jgi:phage terminase small subunit
MGIYGRAPQPTAMRVLNGNPSHRPLPQNEPQYANVVPQPPSKLTAAAQKVWDTLVTEMAASGVLRSVDGFALCQLCEDQAWLDELRAGVRSMARELAKQAKKKGHPLPGGPLVALSRTTDGRRSFNSIRELSSSLIAQRREFGLTPASNSRVETSGFGEGSIRLLDPFEAAIA